MNGNCSATGLSVQHNWWWQFFLTGKDQLHQQMVPTNLQATSFYDNMRLSCLVCCREVSKEWSKSAFVTSWRPTATGIDQIPAWFLRLGAFVFATLLARLFHQSLTSAVPRQWKTAVITPIPKIATPALPSDFRPISITPVLSRLLEKFFVREFIYPALYTSRVSRSTSPTYSRSGHLVRWPLLSWRCYMTCILCWQTGRKDQVKD